MTVRKEVRNCGIYEILNTKELDIELHFAVTGKVPTHESKVGVQFFNLLHTVCHEAI